MKNSTIVMFLMFFVSTTVIGAATRETGKLYLVVNKSNQHVIQMGISPDSVAIQDVATQELRRIDGEKPTHLSEIYFKLVDGKLVDMSSAEMDVVKSKIRSNADDAEVARLKAIMARDPAGFRAVLGL